MRSVRELHGIHSGADIYIIGTGASMRVFPESFFDGKLTIGLNLAWQLLPVNYSITMAPQLNLPEFLGQERPKNTIWITKRDKYAPYSSPKMIEFADKNYYYFKTDGKLSLNALDEPSESGRVIDWVINPKDEYLYLWTSISQSAVNLAANMGAKNIILVGCDNCALSENHHAHNQHTLWKNESPDLRYMQYYLGLREIRSALKTRKINVLSLTPFLKLNDPELDFKMLCKEANKPLFIQNDDIYQGLSMYRYNMRYLNLSRIMIKKNLSWLLKSISNIFFKKK